MLNLCSILVITTNTARNEQLKTFAKQKNESVKTCLIYAEIIFLG